MYHITLGIIKQFEANMDLAAVLKDLRRQLETTKKEIGRLERLEGGGRRKGQRRPPNSATWENRGVSYRAKLTSNRRPS